jgi:hypothetical protein
VGAERERLQGPIFGTKRREAENLANSAGF